MRNLELPGRSPVHATDGMAATSHPLSTMTAIKVLQDGGNAMDAIAFNQAGPAYRGIVNLTYRLDVNEFRGVESAQLIVEQIVSVSESTR